MSTTIKTSQARETLSSLLIAYDKRVSMMERGRGGLVNIYRMGHLLKAMNNVFDGLDEMTTVYVLKTRMERFFIVSDCSPAKKFLQLLDAQPEQPENERIYLIGYPTERKKQSKKSKK